MHFEVLGPLRVRTGDSEVAIRLGRERVLLAVLLLRAGTTVPVEQLIDALWPEAPPQSARNQVQACVSRLRRRLADAGMPSDVIATDPSGYRLQVDQMDIDAHQFRAHLGNARNEVAHGRQREARDSYRAAIGLWRGPALADLDGPTVRQAAAVLDEEHTQALVERIEVELALGQAGELIGELTELVQRYPYREGLHAGLMRALYQLGRPADALAAFRRVRQLLRDELGTEPGAELQGLHKAILNRDPSLKVTRTATAQSSPPIPRELPPAASCFVGREQEAAQLAEALTPPDRSARHRPPVVLLYGPGGVGKSALAVRVAHEVAEAYPDGQLYVDLSGSTPGRQPVLPAEVLSRFLRRLGVSPEQVPADETDASALLRSISAGRRLLLVLDNAAKKDHVAPLLPGSGACGVVITSRHPLSSLDVDQRLRVDVLASDDGLRLLSGLADGATPDLQAARAIVALSGGLPLAIRIAAGRLASRPDISATEYAQRLADRSRRLDELKLDDLAVRACIRTSYEALQSSDDPAERLAAQAFQMLGLLHVADFAPGVIAAMLSRPGYHRAQKALDRLVDAQLLEPIRGGRYRPHDLVRLVAAETATVHNTRPSRYTSLRGAMVYYSGASALAGNLLFPGRTRAFPAPCVPTDVDLPAFDSPAQARAWVGTELQNLVSVVEQVIVAGSDVDHETLWLAEEVWDHLHVRNEWQTARRLGLLALKMGRRQKNQAMAAWGGLALGRAEANVGDYDAAADNLEQALRTMLAMKWTTGTALGLTALGVLSNWRGDPSTALAYYADAMELAEKHQIRSIRPALLLNTSSCYLALRRPNDAAKEAMQCVAASRDEGNLQRLGDALNNLGAAYCLSGKLAEAVRCADEALACAREVGNVLSEREILINRSLANLWLGYPVLARQDIQEVLSPTNRKSDEYTKAAALRVQAKIFTATDSLVEAQEATLKADAAYAELRCRRDPVIEALLTHDSRPTASQNDVGPTNTVSRTTQKRHSTASDA